ncbi:hypothetical protein Drorol1_Dr00011455 [Drosera rotundifolia]
MSGGAPRPPLIQNMRLSYNTDGTPVLQPVSDDTSTQPQTSLNNAGQPNLLIGYNINAGIGDMMVKKKRGRPRKFWPEDSVALWQLPRTVNGDSGEFSPVPVSVAAQKVERVADGGEDGEGDVVVTPLSLGEVGVKKRKGRPPGAKNKPKFDPFGFAARLLTPHIFTVKPGEDISSRIMSFSQSGQKAVCILSATGAISNVTLRQAATSGGTVTYEGRYEILTLLGSFMISEIGGQRITTGGLSVSLSGPDGRVFGGGVAGLLIAASPVQVVLGSFVPESQMQPRTGNHIGPLSAPPSFPYQSGTTGGRSPPSGGTLSISSGGGSGSPLEQEYRS